MTDATGRSQPHSRVKMNDDDDVLLWQPRYLGNSVRIGSMLHQ